MPPLCGFVVNLAQSEKHVPNAHRVIPTPEQLDRQRRIVRELACVKRGAAAAPEAVPVALSPIAYEGVSALTSSILEQIGSAVLEATDSYDLSSRLMPALDQAFSLEPTEQALVLGTISTAQNSFEYWESAWPQFSTEVISEYSPCLTSGLTTGYTYEETQSACVGTQLVSGAIGQRPTHFRLSLEPAVSCGSFGAWEGMKRTAKSDADGFLGGFLGGLVTKDPKAAAVTGGAAAVGKSAVTGIYVTIDLWKCAMGWKDNTQKA